MRPYFSVGEEVILCSKSANHLNGEYIILDIDGPMFAEESKNGSLYYGYLYKLPVSFNECDLFFESALRKKHKPADQSFQELIKSTRELKV